MEGLSQSPLYQFALSVLISKELNIICYHYDPLFTEIDNEIITLYNAIPMKNSFNFDYTTEFPILYYMIHCNISLYSNILNYHWNDLSKIIIIGNTLINYDIILVSLKERKEDINCVLKLIKYIKSELINITYNEYDTQMYNSFNDTSINIFNEELINNDIKNGLFPVKPELLWIE